MQNMSKCSVLKKIARSAFGQNARYLSNEVCKKNSEVGKKIGWADAKPYDTVPGKVISYILKLIEMPELLGYFCGRFFFLISCHVMKCYLILRIGMIIPLEF